LSAFVKVATTKDLSPGEMLFVEFDGQAVLLVNVDGTFYAVSEECTHSSCPLSDGILQGKVVECKCHGATFDVSTGNVLTPPADEPLTTYPVKIDGEDILISSPT
jgi:nitrite reductase/ring-hydroxylating ferredoxin subunit